MHADLHRAREGDTARDGQARKALALPEHIGATVQAIAQLQARHRRGGTAFQRLFSRMIMRASRPSFLGSLTLGVLAWIILNLTLLATGVGQPDPPPFYWLQGLVGLGALFMTSLILATQRREDELTDLREQLTLELAILSEQKAAKIIQLLEELRRDIPQVIDRIDHEAHAMGRPADPEAVMEAIKDRRDGD